MSLKSRCFPYERSIVINALYDAIDALGLSLDSANSMRGTLIVSDKGHGGKMRIAIACGLNANQTLVDFYPEDMDASFIEKWSPVILDEIEGRIKRIYQKRKGAVRK